MTKKKKMKRNSTLQESGGEKNPGIGKKSKAAPKTRIVADCKERGGPKGDCSM
jgi:hypothetical protein